MKSPSKIPIFFALLQIFSTLAISSKSSPSSLMAEGAGKSTAGDGESASVHIVYVDRPESEDPEAFHIRTLAPIVGSEEAAKEAVVYHYTHAASGFSARLTPKQVEDLSKQPGVLQVLPDKVLHVHGGQKAAKITTMGLM